MNKQALTKENSEISLISESQNDDRRAVSVSEEQEDQKKVSETQETIEKKPNLLQKFKVGPKREEPRKIIINL